MAFAVVKPTVSMRAARPVAAVAPRRTSVIRFTAKPDMTQKVQESIKEAEEVSDALSLAPIGASVLLQWGARGPRGLPVVPRCLGGVAPARFGSRWGARTERGWCQGQS